MLLRHTWIASVALAFALTACAAEPVALKEAELGTTKNVHLFGNTLLCGQPSVKDLQLAKDQGTKVILTLRGLTETDWDEQSVVEDLGMEFFRVDFRGSDTLTDDVFEQTRTILRESKEDNNPVMMHCGSANRVGAIWIAYRVLDEGVELATAEKEAREIGLRDEANYQKTLEYIKRMKQ